MRKAKRKHEWVKANTTVRAVLDSAIMLARIRAHTDEIRHRGHPLDDETLLAWEAPSGNVFRVLVETTVEPSITIRGEWDHDPSDKDNQHYNSIVRPESVVFFAHLAEEDPTGTFAQLAKSITEGGR